MAKIKKAYEDDAGHLDYAQLERFLDDDDTSGASSRGGGERFSEVRSTKGPAKRTTQHAAKFIEQMDYAEGDDEDEEVEVVVKPKNAKPPVEKKTAPAPQQKTAPAKKVQEPLPPAGSEVAKGPTYPSFKSTPVADARRPQREKAIQMETRAQPEVFLVDRPDDHVESNVYFSGTVSFNDPQAADRFLQLLSLIVDKSAVIFHAVRQQPELAQDLASNVNECMSLLHHFPEAAEEDNIKKVCQGHIDEAQREADVALDVLRHMPPRGKGWEMHDNQRLADSLKAFFIQCCHLMKVSEREQAQQFMVVVKTCLDTVENILMSHKRHAGIYFGHLQGYMDDHLYPLLENRVETTPDQDLKDEYVGVREEIRSAHPQFKGYMDGLWPPGAAERAKTQASYEEKKKGAAPFINALKHLEEILKAVITPISDFEIRFNLPRKPLEEITQKLIRASAVNDRAAVLESARELSSTLKALPEDDPHVAALRMSSRDLVEHSKKVMAKEELPEQMNIIAESIIEEARQMEEEQITRHRTSGAQQTLVDAVAQAADRMSLIAADPARVSRVNDQKRLSTAQSKRAPPQLHEVDALRTSVTPEQRLIEVEEARKAAARISSRASVVVQLAAKRQGGKHQAREQLYEASDRVAKALRELAMLEQQKDPDLDELQRLVTELDDEQAELFGSLPEPSPSLKKRDPALRESMRKSVKRAEAVKDFVEKEHPNKVPGERVVVAAAKVEETLKELEELQDDPTAAADELAILVDEATRHQKELLKLAKDPSNFKDRDDLDDFLMEDY